MYYTLYSNPIWSVTQKEIEKLKIYKHYVRYTAYQLLCIEKENLRDGYKYIN